MKINTDLEISIENKFIKSDRAKKQMKLTIEESIYILKIKEFNTDVEDQAVETILNELKNQQKEIEELKEQCKEVVCVPEGTCFMLESKDINKKWTDKINAKIKEVKKVDIMFYKENVVYILQSLLEEKE